MDWKGLYRAELESQEGKEFLNLLWEELKGDRGLGELLGQGAIVSFPHTALRFSAPLILPLVDAIYRLPGVERVVALGVLHLGALPKPSRTGQGLSGGFTLPVSQVATPFGELPLLQVELPPPVRTAGDILAREFSLDTFLALMKYAADRLRRPPLPVYVGPVREPENGSFQVAGELARALRPLLGRGTVVVATGDVVHYGRPYGDDPRADGLPADLLGLTEHFRRQLERVLGLALKRRDYVQAYDLSEEGLKSDQRNLLPVIAELLGPGADFRILEFSLSDYAPIFQVEPPCVVASALIAYLPAG